MKKIFIAVVFLLSTCVGTLTIKYMRVKQENKDLKMEIENLKMNLEFEKSLNSL